MADNPNEKKRGGADKTLRKARDRFLSSRTQQALREALNSIAGITTFDVENVIQQLSVRLNSFKLHRGFKEARAAMVAWVVRLGNLIVQLRAILPDLGITSHVTTMLFMRLPELAGTDVELREWAIIVAQREQSGIDALTEWITEHRKAVHRGIWEVLRTCMDLGVTDTNPGHEGERPSINLTVEELEVQVWAKVAYCADEILRNPDKSIQSQLESLGRWAARAWKTERLREKRYLSDKLTIGLDGLEKIVTTDGGDEELGVVLDEVIDLRAIHNPAPSLEMKWTSLDLEHELRLAGPFRADDVYDGELILTAA